MALGFQIWLQLIARSALDLLAYLWERLEGSRHFSLIKRIVWFLDRVFLVHLTVYTWFCFEAVVPYWHRLLLSFHDNKVIFFELFKARQFVTWLTANVLRWVSFGLIYMVQVWIASKGGAQAHSTIGLVQFKSDRFVQLFRSSRRMLRKIRLWIHHNVASLYSHTLLFYYFKKSP